MLIGLVESRIFHSTIGYGVFKRVQTHKVNCQLQGGKYYASELVLNAHAQRTTCSDSIEGVFREWGLVNGAKQASRV